MRKLILISLMVVLLTVPVGCGKPKVEEGTYEDFVVQYWQTRVANQMLKQTNENLQAEYDDLKKRAGAREQDYINTINILTSENEVLRVEVALVKGFGGSQQEELASALTALEALKFGRLTFIRETEQKYEALLEKYNKVTALYPPTHFAKKAELDEWRASTGNITGSKACLELQRQAIAEGYIVSLHPSFNYCTAVAGGALYKITPGNKGLVEYIKKVE